MGITKYQGMDPSCEAEEDLFVIAQDITGCSGKKIRAVKGREQRLVQRLVIRHV